MKIGNELVESRTYEAHGHRGIQDIVFGTTIDGVRHEIEAPVMIVPATGG